MYVEQTSDMESNGVNLTNVIIEWNYGSTSMKLHFSMRYSAKAECVDPSGSGMPVKNGEISKKPGIQDLNHMGA